jgi:hypothetical protein
LHCTVLTRVTHTAPTVRMELTEERLNEILAGMGTEDTLSKSEVNHDSLPIADAFSAFFEQHPRGEARASKKQPSKRTRLEVTSERKQEVKDQQRLPEEMQNCIALLAVKETPQERQETITKVLGTGWEKAPTVRMELTEERLNEILAGMALKILRASRN